MSFLTMLAGIVVFIASYRMTGMFVKYWTKKKGFAGLVWSKRIVLLGCFILLTMQPIDNLFFKILSWYIFIELIFSMLYFNPWNPYMYKSNPNKEQDHASV